MKIVKHLEEYLLWHKGVSETKKKMYQKKKKDEFCVF